MKERVGDESEIFNIVLFMVSYILITGYSILLVFFSPPAQSHRQKN